MINALTQSPLVGKKYLNGKNKLKINSLLVRDIIDMNSTYEDFEALEEDDELKINKKAKNKEEDKDEKKDEEKPI